jgi:WhiB family redox-sensing transcriptional regulator
MTGARAWNDPALPPVAFEPDIACSGVDPEVFFPPSGFGSGKKTRKAKRICGKCPHIAPCLAWAIDTRQDYGIWAGTTAAERRTMIEGTAA